MEINFEYVFNNDFLTAHEKLVLLFLIHNDGSHATTISHFANFLQTSMKRTLAVLYSLEDANLISVEKFPKCDAIIINLNEIWNLKETNKTLIENHSFQGKK